MQARDTPNSMTRVGPRVGIAGEYLMHLMLAVTPSYREATSTFYCSRASLVRMFTARFLATICQLHLI